MPDVFNPHIDFVLPGWEITPLARQTCLSSLAATYSRKWNPRNLECPWYEPWAHILQDLVADLPALAVAPQSYLWYYRHPVPGDHRIEPPSTQDDDNWLDAGDSTLDSISSIHVGSSRNKHQLVDFAITRKVSRNLSVHRSEHEPESIVLPVGALGNPFYLSRKVDYVGVPLLCELKRGVHRTSDFCASAEHANVTLSIATEQLVRQAHHLFQMYTYQQEVLLVAVSGFWWSYRLLSREESRIATEDEMRLAAQYEEAGAEADEGEGEIHANPRGGVVDCGHPTGDEQNPPDLPSIYHRLNVTFQDQASSDIGLHLLMTQTDFRLRTVLWSEPLLFDTPPSNQVLYLIHQRLKNIVNEGYGGTKG